MNIEFSKYHGTGNDFIMIDNRIAQFPASNPKLIEELCHRRFGIGADGVILLEYDNMTDFRMVYFNADGNESSMCGNGGRCFIRFARDLGLISENIQFIAIDGMHEGIIDGDVYRLKMKDVHLSDIQINADHFVLDTGSPHYVQFHHTIATVDIITDARKIRYNDVFKKKGINVNFIQASDNSTLQIRTYERGVENETYSCGTGAVAAAIAFHLSQPENNKVRTIDLITPGGKLQVSFTQTKAGFEHIWLIGPAKKVFSGSLLV